MAKAFRAAFRISRQRRGRDPFLRQPVAVRVLGRLPVTRWYGPQSLDVFCKIQKMMEFALFIVDHRHHYPLYAKNCLIFFRCMASGLWGMLPAERRAFLLS
jgi:hypothetical protein